MSGDDDDDEAYISDTFLPYGSKATMPLLAITEQDPFQ
jgi:hypothetical protein